MLVSAYARILSPGEIREGHLTLVENEVEVEVMKKHLEGILLPYILLLYRYEVATAPLCSKSEKKLSRSYI
jgi:hypothetical protein